MKSITRLGARGAAAVGSATALLLSLVALSGGSANAQTMGPVDKAAAAGLNAMIRSYDVVSGDWSGDNFDDLLVIPHDPDALRQGVTSTSVPFFYQNNGDGTFFEKSHSFAGRDRHACAMNDMNVDGRLDFFCTEGFSSTRGKELGIQRPDGSFSDAASASGLYARGGGRYRTAALFDANNDGYPDIYMTRYYGPNSWDGNPIPAENPPKPNEFWLSHGGRYYSNQPAFGLDQPIGAPKDASSCAQGADYDGDGYQDLFVCGYEALYLYHNEAGRSFSDARDAMGIDGYAVDAELVDIDGDDDLDLVRTRGNYIAVRLWNGTAWSPSSYSLKFDRGGQGLATGDFNGDGLKDIYLVRNCINRQDKPDTLFMNKGDGRFEPTSLPALPRGKACGDAVAATDYDGDGLTDFSVVNGDKKKAGPIQLWSYKAQ